MALRFFGLLLVAIALVEVSLGHHSMDEIPENTYLRDAEGNVASRTGHKLYVRDAAGNVFERDGEEIYTRDVAGYVEIRNGNQLYTRTPAGFVSTSTVDESPKQLAKIYNKLNKKIQKLLDAVLEAHEKDGKHH